jgi:hypothetical protein
MNRSTIAMPRILAAAAAITATAAMAATSDSDMLRCAAIAARDARLDCYDALTHQLSSKAAAPVAALPAMPPAPAPAPASARAAASADTPAASQAPAAAVVASDPKNFGLTAAQQHTLDLGPQMITSNISILSSNQKGETVVVLENGQTWSLTDNDGWLATGQAVRIKKAAMGSYLMLIPSNHSYHVRRLK